MGYVEWKQQIIKQRLKPKFSLPFHIVLSTFATLISLVWFVIHSIKTAVRCEQNKTKQNSEQFTAVLTGTDMSAKKTQGPMERLQMTRDMYM